MKTHQVIRYAWSAAEGDDVEVKLNAASPQDALKAARKLDARFKRGDVRVHVAPGRSKGPWIRVL